MKVDYLIVGAGASGMAFLDVILAETEATVAIVDRRDAPGGHWNDAYPFVRLHQSSSFYGVPSRVLGQDRVTHRGYNAGLFELASKYEILHYYEDLMETQYIPSGRVTYFPMSEYRDGAVCSLMSDDKTPIEVARKTVQAGVWGDLSTIPATHKRSFTVDVDVTCIPPNELPRQAPHFDAFTILGAGKTAMDGVLWLLARGVDPDAITWVRPNDYWIFQREMILPHRDFFKQSIGSMTADLESLATARTVEEHCLNLEACGRWQRIDPSCWPRRFHAAVCSSPELTAMRRITDVVRAGHVKALYGDRMVLEQGERATPETRLYVDCTARAGVPLNRPDMKVFDGDVINLAMVRPFQPVFSAALIAHIEACIPDEDIRQQATGITDFFDTPAGSLVGQRQGFINQHVWNKVPQIKDWIDRCRLNAAVHLMQGLTPDDTEEMQMLGRLGPLTAAAVENIPNILAAGEA